MHLPNNKLVECFTSCFVWLETWSLTRTEEHMLKVF